MPVCENIRRIREARGITKTFIANALGMSLQGYRYLEDGDVRLDVERMKRVRKHDGMIILEAANPSYPPRIFAGEQENEVHIVGKVIETRRKY